MTCSGSLTMNETYFGNLWDVSFDEGQDIIQIDAGDTSIGLTKNDLLEMLEELNG